MAVLYHDYFLLEGDGWLFCMMIITIMKSQSTCSFSDWRASLQSEEEEKWLKLLSCVEIFFYQPLFFVGLYRTPVAQVAGTLRRTAHRPSYFPSRTSVTIFLNIITISTTLAILANLDDLSQLVCLHWELVPLLAVEPAVHTGSHPRKDQFNKGGFQKMFGMWKLPQYFNDLGNFLLQTRKNLISIFDVFRPAKKNG